jgi:hypothetical protein
VQSAQQLAAQQSNPEGTSIAELAARTTSATFNWVSQPDAIVFVRN